MKSEDLGDWLQIIGLFGVIASLIFVGLELKQAREIAVSAAYQARADSAIEVSSIAAGSPEYLSGSAKLWSRQPELISATEHEAILWVFSAQLDMFENLHFQYKSGFLNEEHWNKGRDQIRCRMQEPFFFKLASGYRPRESFAAELEKIKVEALESPRKCWVEHQDT